MSIFLPEAILPPCNLAALPDPTLAPIGALGSILDQGNLVVQNNGTAWVPYSSAGGSTYPILGVAKIFTNAQLLAWPTTPLHLVDAPGALKRILPTTCTLAFSAVTATYTNVDATYAAISLSMTDKNGAWVATPLINDSTTTPHLTQVTDFMGGTVHDAVYDFLIPFIEIGDGDQWVPKTWNGNGFTETINKPLVLAFDNSAAGNLTGGDPSQQMLVIVNYYVQTLF